MSHRAVLLVVSLLSGCALSFSEIGTRVPGADGLQIGRSTKAEVLEALGPPHLVRRQFDGELYTWRHTESRRRSLTVLPVYVKAFYYSDLESRRDDLSLLFDREGVLQGVGLRRETED